MYECDREPHPATRRLMATLGVEVVVTTVAQDVQTRCERPHCRWSFVGTALRGRAALGEHVARMHGGTAPNGHVLDATDRVEPQRLANSARAVTWTRESAIAAVQAHAAKHGRPPSINAPGECPRQPTAKKIFGSYAAMIEAAGFARPTRSTRYETSGREPTETAAVTAESTVQPSAGTPGTAAPVSLSEPVVCGDEPGSSPDDAPPDGPLPASIDELTDHDKIAGWRGGLAAEALRCELRAAAYRKIEEGLAMLEQTAGAPRA